MTRPEHYRSYSAVFPILLREGANGQEVLLHLRQNTGYMDGCWDFAGSGHVDENETARQAVARECLEELGITVNPADMEFVHLCHRVAGGDAPLADGIFDLVIGLFRQVGLSSCLKHDKIRSPLAFLWVVYGKKERTVHNLYTACAACAK